MISLVCVTVCVDGEELIHLALEVLPPQYDAFCSATQKKKKIYAVTLEELSTLLNAN